MTAAKFANAAIKITAKVITIPLTLYMKRSFSIDTPKAWTRRPTESNEDNPIRSKLLAFLSSRSMMSSKANGTYSAKFAWTRIARSTDLLRPVPMPTLCCRLALMTLINSRTKNTAKTAAKLGMIVNVTVMSP